MTLEGPTIVKEMFAAALCYSDNQYDIFKKIEGTILK
jgi:hypothetical protein